MEEPSFRLPLVDFSSFASLANPSYTGEAPTPQQQRTAEEIHAANRKHGFVCLRNSGIPKDLAQRAFATSKELFSASPSEKARWKAIDPSTNTGYVGCGAEALNRRRRADLKEAFNVRATSFSDSDDLSGTPASFQTLAPKLWEDLNELAQKYAVVCAWALGLEPSYFTKTLTTMDLCTMRWLHYPPCSPDEVTGESAASEQGCAIRLGEHTDFGIFTFLFVNDWEDSSSLGLQIKKPPTIGCEPTWESVTLDDKTVQLLSQDATAALIVNTGALLARWTNDLWTATPHRVVVTPESRAFDRYSIAMFIDPDAQTVCAVHDSFVKEGEEPKYPPITSIEYLLMKLREAQGVKT